MIRGQRLPAARALFALVLALSLAALLVLASGLLAALPALLAFLPLIAGRYLGSSALDALIERRTGAARQRPAKALRPRRLSERFVVSGARLMAHSLAQRPPPAAPIPA